MVVSEVPAVEGVAFELAALALLGALKWLIGEEQLGRVQYARIGSTLAGMDREAWLRP